MKRFIKGIPLGVYPEPPSGARTLFKAPADKLQQFGVHLITLGKWEADAKNTDYCLTFASWLQDHRFTHHALGNWYISEFRLTRHQLRTLKKIPLWEKKE